MSDDIPPSWMDSLHAFPDLAQHVGQFVAAFATMERMIWFLYGKVLGSNDEGAIAMFGHIESFGIKLTAIQNFVPHSAHIAPEEKSDFYNLLEAARKVNAFRNSLAHGIYLSDNEGTKVEILTYATSTGRRKAKQFPLTTALLGVETDKALKLRRAIRDKIFPDFAGAHGPKHVR
jgi:hypothetical protein